MIVAFIGHRNVDDAEPLAARLTGIVVSLIRRGADTFLFGSGSAFDSLCLETATVLKEKYRHIRRVYVRSSFESISVEYKDYLMTLYDETVFPQQVRHAGISSYVKRNEAMIDMCDVLVTYFDSEYVPMRKRGRSGTALAVDYARKSGREIINVFER